MNIGQLGCLDQQTSSLSSLDNQQQDNVTNLVDTHDQQGDEQWQQQRGNAQRGGQFSNGSGNRAYHRGRSNNYHQQWRGSRKNNLLNISIRHHSFY